MINPQRNQCESNQSRRSLWDDIHRASLMHQLKVISHLSFFFLLTRLIEKQIIDVGGECVQVGVSVRGAEPLLQSFPLMIRTMNRLFHTNRHLLTLNFLSLDFNWSEGHERWPPLDPTQKTRIVFLWEFGNVKVSHSHTNEACVADSDSLQSVF